MEKRTALVCVAFLLVGLLPPRVGAYMKEGVAKGTVITVGEDRVVVQAQEGGQITFEVGNVKKGAQWVRDEKQLPVIRALKKGDKMEVQWGQDHTGHYFIRHLAKLDLDGKPVPELVREGRVRGTVITVGEERLVVQRAEGGQLSLEPRWVKTGNKWGRDQEQIAFFQTLKQGDQIEAAWKLDEGTHYCVQEIKKGDGKQPQGR